MDFKEYNDSIPGWLGAHDVTALYTLAKEVPENGVIVEMGSMHGKSACCLASVATTAKVYCFDLWPGNDIKAEDGVKRPNTLETFVENTKPYSNVIPKKMTEPNVFVWDDTKIDLMFLDAAHTNPSDWDAIEYWLPKIKPGGTISGHDYYTLENSEVLHFPDIADNIRKLEKILDIQVRLHLCGCVWSFKLPL